MGSIVSPSIRTIGRSRPATHSRRGAPSGSTRQIGGLAELEAQPASATSIALAAGAGRGASRASAGSVGARGHHRHVAAAANEPAASTSQIHGARRPIVRDGITLARRWRRRAPSGNWCARRWTVTGPRRARWLLGCGRGSRRSSPTCCRATSPRAGGVLGRSSRIWCRRRSRRCGPTAACCCGAGIPPEVARWKATPAWSRARGPSTRYGAAAGCRGERSPPIPARWR